MRPSSELREKPAGTIRITATEYAADTILLPKLAKLLRDYPDIKVEIIIDYGLTDIVAQRYDAGVRSGEQVAKDMIAVRIGAGRAHGGRGRSVVFQEAAEPKRPQDLIGHNCINLRLPTHGGLYAWEFEKAGRELKVRVEGQLTSTRTAQMLNAALAGVGLAYVPEGLVAAAYRQGPSQTRAGGLVSAVLRATTSTTRAGGNRRRRSHWWSMRCATAADASRTPRRATRRYLACAPSAIGVVRTSLSDLTILSVVALYFLKCAVSRCDLYASVSL